MTQITAQHGDLFKEIEYSDAEDFSEGEHDEEIVFGAIREVQNMNRRQYHESVIDGREWIFHQ